jgi:hypothetical protein
VNSRSTIRVTEGDDTSADSGAVPIAPRTGAAATATVKRGAIRRRVWKFHA